MQDEKQSQIFRILSLYNRFLNGQQIVKKDEAIRFLVSEKSIQRDIDNIRDFIEIDQPGHYIAFNRALNAYMLEHVDGQSFTKEEIVKVLQVLIDTNIFAEDEFNRIQHKVLQLANKEHRLFIERMLANYKRKVQI